MSGLYERFGCVICCCEMPSNFREFRAVRRVSWQFSSVLKLQKNSLCLCRFWPKGSSHAEFERNPRDRLAHLVSIFLERLSFKNTPTKYKIKTEWLSAIMHRKTLVCSMESRIILGIMKEANYRCKGHSTVMTGDAACAASDDFEVLQSTCIHISK